MLWNIAIFIKNIQYSLWKLLYFWVSSFTVVVRVVQASDSGSDEVIKCEDEVMNKYDKTTNNSTL